MKNVWKNILFYFFFFIFFFIWYRTSFYETIRFTAINKRSCFLVIVVVVVVAVVSNRFWRRFDASFHLRIVLPSLLFLNHPPTALLFTFSHWEASKQPFWVNVREGTRRGLRTSSCRPNFTPTLFSSLPVGQIN